MTDTFGNSSKWEQQIFKYNARRTSPIQIYLTWMKKWAREVNINSLYLFGKNMLVPIT